MQSRFLLGTALLAASMPPLLAGCGSTPTPSASGGLTPAARVAESAHGARHSSLLGFGHVKNARIPKVHSWLHKPKLATPLVYLSDAFGNVVNIYDQTGTNQSPIGQISGFNEPQGLWVDINNNLWVVNTNTYQLFAYHRATITPFRTLSDPNGKPAGVCGNNNKSEVIATDIISNTGGDGQTINIYDRGATTPSTVLTDPNASDLYECAVDSHGNLFVTLSTVNYPYGGELDEFPKGSTTPVVLSTNFLYPIGITIDKYNAISVVDFEGQDYPYYYSSKVYLFDPPYTQGPAYSYDVNNAAFIEAALNKAQTQLWVANSINDPSAQSYSYPHGTFENATSSSGLKYPDGIALSPASKQ